mgnify:CR=1 FL=1
MDSVRGLDCRCGIRLDKATLYFGCKGRGMLLSTEGALHVSIDYYDAMWSGHLELEVSIVRHRIESSECGLFEQCMIATAEGDDVKDQVFASEVVR